MELMVKRGYKQTEVGVIPEDWNIKNIGEVVSYKNGVAHENCVVENGEYVIVNSKFVSTEGRVVKFSNQNRCPVNKDEVLMVLSDVPNGKAIAKCYYVEENNRYTLNQRICSFKSAIVDSKYLFYVLNRNPYYLQFDDGVKQTNLKNEDVLSCPIPLSPTLTEQKAIATALSDVDNLIANLELLINKKKAIKQGAMQQLLTPPHKGGKRLAGFTGEWVEKKLGECLKYEQPTKYIVENSDYEGQSQTPVLTAGKSFLLGYTDEDFGIFNHYPVIIFDDFTTSNQFVNFSFKVKSSAMKMLQPVSEEININFMFSIMNQIRFSLGDDHKRRWIAEFSKIDVFIPEKDEQQAISNILSDMEDEINELETKKIKFQDIKQGMMQELLTGKTRLV